ncbi:hypothetical protein U0070_026209, partial [Myodes glareolus]
EVGGTSALAPKIGSLGLSPKKVGDDIAKATGNWKFLRITVKLAIRTAGRLRRCPLPLLRSKPSRSHQETGRSRGTFNTVEIALSTGSSAPNVRSRERSGIIKEILGTAQSVVGNVVGRHLHDISDDISDVVECPATGTLSQAESACFHSVPRLQEQDQTNTLYSPPQADTVSQGTRALLGGQAFLHPQRASPGCPAVDAPQSKQVEKDGQQDDQEAAGEEIVVVDEGHTPPVPVASSEHLLPDVSA